MSLVDHICCCCDERERNHLNLLAQCIGFETTSTFPTNIDVRGGGGGDLSCFLEQRRLHILSTSLLRQRLQLEWHALGIEEDNCIWSRLYTDMPMLSLYAIDDRGGFCINNWQFANRNAHVHWLMAGRELDHITPECFGRTYRHSVMHRCHSRPNRRSIGVVPKYPYTYWIMQSRMPTSPHMVFGVRWRIKYF